MYIFCLPLPLANFHTRIQNVHFKVFILYLPFKGNLILINLAIQGLSNTRLGDYERFCWIKRMGCLNLGSPLLVNTKTKDLLHNMAY